MAAENHIINYDGSVKNLNTTLKTHVSVMGEVVQKYSEWVLPKFPSEFINNLNKIADANERIFNSNKKVVDSTKEVEQARKLKAEAEIKEIDVIIKKLKLEAEQIQLQIKQMNLDAKKEKQINAIVNGLQKETAALEKQNNTYNKIQAKVNGTTQAYNNLAAKKSLGLDLSAKEERMLTVYTNRLNLYGTKLKEIDATIGKHQRNVGNYKSGWDGLGHSINQLTREMPAFAVSLNTGFLALSNNLPMLFDEISRVKNNIADLKAKGEPTKSFLATLAGSFFSLQTLISIGVTLLTLYGGKLIEMIAQSVKGVKSINAIAEAKKKYNNSVLEGTKNAQQEIIELKAYVSIAKDVKKSTEERAIAVNKLRDLYPGYFKDLTDEQIMNSDLVDVTNELTNALIKRAIYTASINKMTENASKILDLEAELRLESQKLKVQREQVKIQADKTKEVLTTTTRDEAYHTGRLRNESDKLAGVQQRMVALANEKKSIEEQNIFLQTKTNALVKEQLKHEDKIAKPEKVKKTKDTTEKDRQKELDEQYRLEVARINQMEEGIDKELDLLNAWYTYQQELHKNNATELLIIDIDYFTKLAEIRKKEYDKDNEAFIKSNDEKEKEYEAWEKDYLKGLEEFENAKQFWREWEEDKILKSEEHKQEMYLKTVENLKNILSSSFDGLGFGSMSFLFDEQLKEMWENTETTTGKMAIAFQVFGQIANDVFAKLKESSDAYYDNQYNQLEKEKDVALKFAGDNTAGKQAIEEQYEARRLQIKRQQAKQDKDMALFQAFINIAQGITAALAQGGPAGFVLAALVGALGAVQIASIASQPLPQYFKGRNDGPAEWAIVDELRPEVHTDKHGNVKSFGSTGGANMRFLEKGDKIYKSHSDFFREMSQSSVSPDGTLNIVNNGLSKADLEDVMSRTVGNQSNSQTFIDENGFNTFVINGQSKTRIRNRRTKFGK